MCKEYRSPVTVELNTMESRLWNFDDPSERQEFDERYGFHSDSVYDIPEDRGVRMFEHGCTTVLCSDNVNSITAALELI